MKKSFIASLPIFRWQLGFAQATRDLRRFQYVIPSANDRKTITMRLHAGIKRMAVAGVAGICLLAGAGIAHADSAKNVLRQRPFAPTDQTLFSPLAYPNTPPLEPARGGELTEGQALSRLSAYLAEGFPDNPRKVQQGLALFNNPIARQKILSPTLRAAFAGLIGTIGEPAIDFILNATTPAGLPKVFAIGFGVPSEWTGDIAIARTIIDPLTEQASYVVNPKYIAEDPFAFTSVLAHEVLHSDIPNSNSEETINLLLQSFVYLEQLAQHSGLPTTGTELARRNNTNALALLNSGTGAGLGLFKSNNNAPILPGSIIPITSWFEQFQNAPGFANVPGNVMLGAYLKRALKPSGRVCSPAEFSLDLLRCIDRHLSTLSDKELLAAARSLRLDIPPRHKDHDKVGDDNDDKGDNENEHDKDRRGR